MRFPGRSRPAGPLLRRRPLASADQVPVAGPPDPGAKTRRARAGLPNPNGSSGCPTARSGALDPDSYLAGRLPAPAVISFEFPGCNRPRGGVSHRPHGRSVAQPGRALSSGGRGRRFESCHSDHDKLVHSGHMGNRTFRRDRLHFCSQRAVECRQVSRLEVNLSEILMPEADELKRFQAKWAPVRRPEARKNRDLKRRCDSIRARAALGRNRPQYAFHRSRMPRTQGLPPILPGLLRAITPPAAFSGLCAGPGSARLSLRDRRQGCRPRPRSR